MPSGGNKKPPHKGTSAGGGGGAAAKTKHHHHQSQNAPGSGRKSNVLEIPGTAGAANTAAATAVVDDDFNSGFGQYLRSPQAVEMMKLFVIANTVLVFFTMAWPQMQQSFYVIKSLFSDGDEDEL